MSATNSNMFILENKNKIEDFIEKISVDMFDYVKASKNNFVLLYKYLTHSDLATFGKATKKDSLVDNFLYYINEDNMKMVEQKTGKPFQTAHQSCIGLSKEFYKKIGIPNPRDSDIYLINDYMEVYLVNSSLEYFNSKYTKMVFDKLCKQIIGRKIKSWDFSKLDLNLSNTNFTPTQLHVAVHGLGMQMDNEFHKLRHHLFRGDTFMLLCEIIPDKQNKLFIVVEKNPVFFSIIGLTNKSYENYQKRVRERLIKQALLNNMAESEAENEVTRAQQAAWRNELACEMMGYTQENRQIFCPFTFITVNFDDLGALFVASHIKGFSDKNTAEAEKYDINNGLLLCANADALFDKHLITINENKELVFSFLLDNDIILKQKLLLMQPIFQPILNEKRMKYLAYHRAVFEELEEKRRAN